MSHVRVGGTWRAIESMWVRIGGVWREMESAWVNIGGTWREINILKVIEYFGVATSLLDGTYALAATSVSDYALFAGGSSSAGGAGTTRATKRVEAYNTSLVKSLAPELSVQGFTTPHQIKIMLYLVGAFMVVVLVTLIE